MTDTTRTIEDVPVGGRSWQHGHTDRERRQAQSCHRCEVKTTSQQTELEVSMNRKHENVLAVGCAGTQTGKLAMIKTLQLWQVVGAGERCAAGGGADGGADGGDDGGDDG